MTSIGQEQGQATLPQAILVIDDFESASGFPSFDGKGTIPSFNQHGFDGFWIVFDDGSIPPIDAGVDAPGKIALANERFETPRTGGPGALASTRGLRVHGGPYAGPWGAGFGAPLEPLMPFDASGFGGVIFWARRANPQASVYVRLGLSTINDDPMYKVCHNPHTPSVSDACDDVYSINVRLTDDWRAYVVPFADLRQVGFGYKPPNGFASNAILNVTFLHDPGPAFDEWIDDIGFWSAEDGGALAGNDSGVGAGGKSGGDGSTTGSDAMICKRTAAMAVTGQDIGMCKAGLVEAGADAGAGCFACLCNTCPLEAKTCIGNPNCKAISNCCRTACNCPSAAPEGGSDAQRSDASDAPLLVDADNDSG